ncbi:MAG: outer membrane beta-barrel protein [Ginsengibacter sp.]
MDKNLHDIENLFRKALGDDEENPSQKAWDDIKKELDKDHVLSIKKKYNFLKKITLLLLFLLTGLSIYVWEFQDKNPVRSNKDFSGINEKSKTKNDTSTGESGTITLQRPIDSLTINKSDNSKDIKGSVTTNLQKSVDSLTINESNSVKQITKPENKITDRTILKDDNTDVRGPLNSVTARNLSTSPIQKNKIKFNKPDESNLPDISKSATSKFLNQKNGKLIKRESDEVVESKIANQVEDKLSVIVTPSGIEFGHTLPVNETSNPKNIGIVESNTISKFATKESLQNITFAKINPLVPIEKTVVRKPSLKSANGSRFAIAAFYSPDITFHHFANSGLGNSNNSSFDIPEAESHASTLGALIDYTISRHWGLQSGITLARSEFELEYEKPETLYAQPDNSGAIKYKLASPLGDAYVKPSFSNNPNIGDSIFSKSTAYNLRYIGIRLAVKYNFSKGKFNLNLLGGVSANFLTRGQLTTELESGNDNETETTDKIYGLKPFYLSGLAGIGVDYNIYKKFFLCFSPTVQFALSAVNSNVFVQSYPNSLGFVLGIKMKL